MPRPSANGEAVVEVLTTAPRRRWAEAEKVQLVQESLQPGMNISYVARRNGLPPSQLFRWRKLMGDGGKAAIQADDRLSEPEKSGRSRSAYAIWSGCWARRPWRSKSFRRPWRLRVK
jgi:transposase-like protein